VDISFLLRVGLHGPAGTPIILDIFVPTFGTTLDDAWTGVLCILVM